MTDERDTTASLGYQLVMLVLAILAPDALCAQGTTQSWPGLNTAGLSTVYVLDDRGVEVSGTLVRLDPDSILLLIGGVEHRLEAARVRRIDRRGDSLRNGALIGAAVGVAMGLLAAGMSDCPGTDPGGGCAGTRAAALVLSTGIYAAVGAGIDALVVGRTTVYEAPTASARRPRGGRVAINMGLQW
jgi:hypothetical protein